MEANTPTKAATTEAPKKSSKTFVIVLILLVVVGGWFGISKYTYAQHHVETDDAQVEANISPVIPRISGYVTKVLVKDNQRVKKGDTLLVLDDRELKIKVEQAKSALATAQANIGAAEASVSTANANTTSSRASVGTIDAQIETAKVNVWRTTQDYDRYANLIKDHTITQQQYEQQLAAKQTAERQLQVLVEQRKQALSQTEAVATQSHGSTQQVSIANAAIKQRQVDVEDAQLQLSYTVVTAPANGMVSKVNVEAGQYLNAGQSLFSVVLNNDVWIVANFKETQFEKMRVGQKVEIQIDAFPGHKFEAQLSSFAAATGARFALLPPDNSSGNFVKVVQRLPIKIEFKETSDTLIKQLRAGMNATVDVHLD
ncbi:HlyD family secretion protein [Parasediminibacterium sp. JCM 36343]|uniref:HlyD family secretion protein n=1 Tax=Parasediminibacterium sp. JCM 36343 TaxID=3374279 RepID=UPI003978B997